MMKMMLPSTLTRRILRWVLLASVVFFIIATGLGVLHERQRILQNAHDKVQESVNSNLAVISAGLWGYDKTGLTILLKGMTQSGALARIEITDSQGIVASAAQSKASAERFNRVWSVPVMAPNGSNRIGTLNIAESYAELEQNLQSAVVTLIWTKLIEFIGLALVLLLIIYRLIAEPLRKLTNEVVTLDPLDAEARVSLGRAKRRDDELDILADSLNGFLQERSKEMARRLAVEKEIKELNAALEERVLTRTADLDSANALLVHAKLAAEAATRAKSQFLSNMSHEIRTPMNAIIGLTHLIRRSEPTPVQAEWLGKIDSAANHLLHIINDILDISKIEAEHLTLEQVPFKFGTVLENLTSLILHRVNDKGLKLHIDLAPEIAHQSWLGDPLRLGQILLNLTGNAIKFTEQGAITVRARLLEENASDVLLRFAVQDSGIGIASKDQQRLFTAFEQADGSTTRKYGGTGLGLAISKRLVELMGGELGVDSQPGQGSTFWFTVRLSKASDAEVPAVTLAQGSAETRLQAQFAGTRVLLAEDEPVNQEVSRSLLEDAGLAVDVAEDGVQAVDMAQRNHYALILMDMQMPKLNGLDATRQIRTLPGYEHTPILAMTANAFGEDRQACLDAGMNDHIAKPADPEAMFETLLRWLTAY